MKYRVIAVFDGKQQTMLESDNLWIVFIIADTLERYPICHDIHIEKEFEK